MSIVRRIPGVVIPGLLVAVVHMLALGSGHDHDHDATVQVTSPHTCFLCHVSPNIDVDDLSINTGAVMRPVGTPELLTQDAPLDPVLPSGSARSPPA